MEEQVAQRWVIEIEYPDVGVLYFSKGNQSQPDITVAHYFTSLHHARIVAGNYRLYTRKVNFRPIIFVLGPAV